MAEPQQEKRGARRFPLRVPVTVDHDNADFGSADSRCQRARHLFLYRVRGRARLAHRIHIDPSARDHAHRKYPRAMQRSRRAGRERAPDGKMAVAAVIEEYQFLPNA